MCDVFKQALKAVWIILTRVGFGDCYTVTMFYQRGHLRQKYAFPRLNLQNCLISPTAIKNYKLCRFLHRGQNPSGHPSSPCVNMENMKTRRSKIVSRAVATRVCCKRCRSGTLRAPHFRKTFWLAVN